MRIGLGTWLGLWLGFVCSRPSGRSTSAFSIFGLLTVARCKCHVISTEVGFDNTIAPVEHRQEMFKLSQLLLHRLSSVICHKLSHSFCLNKPKRLVELYAQTLELPSLFLDQLTRCQRVKVRFMFIIVLEVKRVAVQVQSMYLIIKQSLAHSGIPCTSCLSTVKI